MVLNQEYVVYIMASSTGTLYLGMTGFFFTRGGQHKAGEMEGFSRTYHCDRLVYFESYDNVNKAINREKQLQRWTRAAKIAWIESRNPRWKDLAENWGKELLFQNQGMKEAEKRERQRINSEKPVSKSWLVRRGKD